MKKIFYLIPLFLLFLIPKAYALDCDLISSATLYDVYSSTSVGSISTSTLDTTSENLLTCNPLYYANATSDSSAGLGWNINLTSLNNSNSYYQLSIYIRVEGSTSIIQSPFRDNYISVGTSNASSLWASGTTNVSDLNYSYNTIKNLEGKYNWTWYVASYIFKANTNFNKIFIPFSTSSLFSGNFYLGGISLTNTGQSSLTSTEINSLLANQSSQIQNEISNMETNINNTINDNFNSCVYSGNLFNKNNLKGGWIRYSDNYYLEQYVDTYSVTDFIPVKPNSTYTINFVNSSGLNSAGIMEYSSNKSWLNIGTPETSNIMTFKTSTSTYYVRFTVRNDSINSITFSGNECSNKIDETNDKLNDVNNSINDLNGSINDSNSSGATDSAGSFFNNFEDNDFGLSGIITAPLNTIKTITSNSCTPINLTIPFVNKDMSLPCMTDIYEEHFGSFLDIYQIITFGMISYWVCVQIYAMVKGFKNPDKDEIEVMDL